MKPLEYTIFKSNHEGYNISSIASTSTRQPLASPTINHTTLILIIKFYII